MRQVGRCRTGSDAWWTAVIDANVHNSDHMGEEERQDLADFRQRASLELRHEIAIQFLRYEAVRAAEGITPRDKDPEAYVEEKKTSKASATAREGCGQGEEGGEDRARELRPGQEGLARGLRGGVTPTSECGRCVECPSAAGQGRWALEASARHTWSYAVGLAGGDETRGRGVAG